LHCTITGASGFIGRNLTGALARRGHSATGWSRASGWFDLAAPPQDAERIWARQLQGTDVVIHLAGRAHVRGGAIEHEAELHRRINFEGTIRLARAAQAAGVRRFIFLSTAKVLGEGPDGPYSAHSPARPQDAYARSKWQAEQALQELAAEGSIEITIIRPPLVYGPGVGANFARLVRLAGLPMPLPLASIDNRRDLIGVDNLADLIGVCIDHPGARNVALLCSDGQPYSLADLLTHIRAAQGRPRWLFPAPSRCIGMLARTILGRAAANRLLEDFEVDISATCTALAWRPPLAMPATLDWLRQRSAP
jgi:nucleoside-diphosphate-sugar epimerase